MKIAALLLIPLALTAACKNKALQKTENPKLSEIRVPQGFHISIFADSVPNARSLSLGDNGTVFVGNRSGDKVFAIVDKDNDGRADAQYTLLSGKDMPNGVAFYKGALYVAEKDKIWRLDDIEQHLDHPPVPVLIFDSLPHDDHHGWKYIGFGPDGKLYVPIGAPCNNCDAAEKDGRYASITRMNPDGSGFEVYASGIRNSVGFDWQPDTKNLWFTENGRDELGDNIPPDELNTAPHQGMNFGYPYCQGGDIPDPEFGTRHPCSDFTPPVVKLAPHTAALGMKFYTGNMFPSTYSKSIFIAEHGSWNRSTPIGYRITNVRFDQNGNADYTVFAEGWLQKDGKAWGRPVSVLQLKDGSLLVSDDFANCIYRITYDGK